jgi:hypothetical protein
VPCTLALYQTLRPTAAAGVVRGAGFGGVFGGIAGGIGTIFDPAPDELGKLSKVQLESRLAEVAHIRTKLNLLESTLKEAAGRL